MNHKRKDKLHLSKLDIRPLDFCKADCARKEHLGGGKMRIVSPNDTCDTPGSASGIIPDGSQGSV